MERATLMLEKMISVDSGAVAYSNAYFGSGSGTYHLDDVNCQGNEISLFSCSRGYGEIGVHNCEPGNEAGVKCVGKCVVVVLLVSVLLGKVCCW